MKSQKKKKKLTFRLETVRDLSHDQLRFVAGGAHGLVGCWPNPSNHPCIDGCEPNPSTASNAW